MENDGYDLEISIVHPDNVSEDEQFVSIYTITNRSDVNFPASDIIIRLTWSEAPFFGVNHVLNIPDLHPEEPWTSEEFIDRPLAPGMGLYMYPFNFSASNNRPIRLLSSDSGIIIAGRIIGGFKIQSTEELGQRTEIRIAIAAILIQAIFQIFTLYFDIIEKTCLFSL